MREKQATVDPLFIERWSPRAFDAHHQVSNETLSSVMEAARWAPSSFNEQPWSIHVAKQATPSFDLFLKALNPANQVWAKRASVLGFFVGKRAFSKNGKENTTFEFDCGSAWMSMTLQARLLDLYTHGMSGFDHQAAMDLLQLKIEEHKVIAAFALGKKDKPEVLPIELINSEKMNGRKNLENVFILHGS